jgi:DNA-binding transcriptional LysR family regulator
MTSLNLVAAGAGITVVPASMQGAHPHAIAYRPFDSGGKLRAPITLVSREADANPAVATFATLARSIAKRWRRAGTARTRSSDPGR